MDVVPTSKSIDNGKGAKVCHSFIHMYTYLEIGRIAGCMKIFAHGISRDFLFTFLFLLQTIVHNVRCQNTLPDTIQTWGQIRRREPLSSEDNSMYFYAQN